MRKKKGSSLWSRVLIVVVGVLVVVGLFNIKEVKNQVATIVGALRSTTYYIPTPTLASGAICLRDANGNKSIDVFDDKEFYLTSIAKCLNVGGAPGESVKFIVGSTFNFSNIFSFSKTRNVAAATYTPTPSPVSTPSPSSSVAPLILSTNGIILAPGKSGTLGILHPEIIGDILGDWENVGLDKKQFIPGKYDCADFARDFEKSNPEKYTVTVIDCFITLSCTDSRGNKKTVREHYGHVINDVHEDPKSKKISGWVSAQTGTQVQLDGNRDGRVDTADSFDMLNAANVIPSDAINDAVNEQRCNSADKFAIQSVICYSNNYENMREMYDAEGAGRFHSGFNPN